MDFNTQQYAKEAKRVLCVTNSEKGSRGQRQRMNQAYFTVKLFRLMKDRMMEL